MIKFVTPEITTENLLLRKLTIEDKEAIYIIRSDKENTKYAGFEPYADIPRAERFINGLAEDLENGEVAFWGITLKESNQVIGTICLMPYDDLDHTVEIGYELTPEFKGKGIMREAMKTLVEYCFNSLSMKCICAETHLQNKPSLKLLEHFKFIEGDKEPVNNFKYFYLNK